MVDEELRALERIVEAGEATPEQIARWKAIKLRGGCAFGAHQELVLGLDLGMAGSALVCSACGVDVGLRAPQLRYEPKT